MKLTFTFTDSPDVASLSKDDIYNTYFEIPDEALHLIGVRERVLKVAELVSFFTFACVHVSCPELELDRYPIKTQRTGALEDFGRSQDRSFIIIYKQIKYHTTQRQFKLLFPDVSKIPDMLTRTYVKGRKKKANLSENRKYAIPIDTALSTVFAENFEELKQQILILLGAEPNGNWEFFGFHPWWRDPVLIKRWNNMLERDLKAEKQKQREALKQQKAAEKAEERRKAREAKMAEQGITPTEPPKTGAGRRVGAVPGVFKGVQFRSQLEIRFVAELEERGVQWIYEGERLADGNYLVDFYLPEYAAWVEVKGVFEARDRLLLKEVAGYLKKERQQRLFVFLNRKYQLVNSSGFRDLTQAEFWTMLLT
jgi:hypothetical protein